MDISYKRKGEKIMGYGYKRVVNQSFEKTEGDLRSALSEQGFGVVTEIDVKNTFKQKLNQKFKKYKILGACEPHVAKNALSLDEQIGLLLPCNLVVYENDDKSTTVATIDPMVQLSIADNRELTEHAEIIKTKLIKAVDKIWQMLFLLF